MLIVPLPVVRVAAKWLGFPVHLNLAELTGSSIVTEKPSHRQSSQAVVLSRLRVLALAGSDQKSNSYGVLLHQKCTLSVPFQRKPTLTGASRNRGAVAGCRKERAPGRLSDPPSPGSRATFIRSATWLSRETSSLSNGVSRPCTAVPSPAFRRQANTFRFLAVRFMNAIWSRGGCQPGGYTLIWAP